MSAVLIQAWIAVLSGVGGYGFGWLSRGIAMDELRNKRNNNAGNGRRLGMWWLVGATVMLLLALVGLLTLVGLVTEQRQVAECIRNEIRKERGATITLADGTVRMLDGLVSPSGTVESRTGSIHDWRTAYVNYLEVLRQVDAQHCADR